MYQLHGNSRIVEMVESDIRHLTGSINKKYFVGRDPNSGFVRFIKFWRLGHESQFIQNSVDKLSKII
jgi:hypothetical protein